MIPFGYFDWISYFVLGTALTLNTRFKLKYLIKIKYVAIGHTIAIEYKKELFMSLLCNL